MRTTTEILASYRDAIRRNFYEFIGRSGDLPPTMAIPADPRAALLLGMQVGRKQGYGSGLVDGTQLGLDVGLEAVDAMLSQPVIFGTPGAA